MHVLSLFDEARPAPSKPFREDAPGTWLAPAYTLAVWQSRIFLAKQRLSLIPDRFQDIMTRGVDCFEKELHRMRGGDNPISVHSTRLRLDSEAIQEIQSALQVEADEGPSREGWEAKMRENQYGLTLGLHIPDIGSVILSHGLSGRAYVDFKLFRDTFFLDSYEDACSIHHVSRERWEDDCNALKIAESGSGIASCKSFMHDGREYINDGQMIGRDFSYCTGWSFRPLDEWDGPTYSYTSHCGAWEDGRMQRGDLRGLVVKVNRKTVVLDGCSLFVDKNSPQKKSVAIEQPASDPGVATTEEEHLCLPLFPED